MIVLLRLVLSLPLLIASVSAANADFYRYTDANGTVNITNSLNAVPQKYRAHVKVVKEDKPSSQDKGAAGVESATQAEPAAQAAIPEPAREPKGGFAGLCERFPWLRPLAYLAGILAAFLVVMRVASAVSSAHLSKLIYLSFFLGVFVLLYKAYVDHVVADTLAVKEKAVTMMKKSVVREAPLPGEQPPADLGAAVPQGAQAPR